MSFAHLDRYAHPDTWLGRRTTPSGRLWMALAAAFAAGLMPHGAWLAPGALAFLIVLGARAGRVPGGALAKRVAHALPFFLLPALALPLSVPGPTLFTIGEIAVTEPGVVRATEILIRATLAVTAVTITVSTTRSADLLRALETLPLPRLVTGSLALGYRYVYVLGDEYERTMRALEGRAGMARGGRLWRARAAALAHLLVRAYHRASRVHTAMLSRGYRERLPTLAREPREGAPVWTAAILVITAMIWMGGLLESLA